MATHLFSSNDLPLVAKNNWHIPEFKGVQISPKKNDYCVCVFVINEGKKVQAQLQEMKKLASQIDIIVADGGSTDGSLELAFLESCSVRTLLTKTGKGKLSAQMRMAFAYALQENYQGVVVIDGNHKDDISAIPDFTSHLEQGYDHIQGSRFIPGGKAINTPFSRLIGLKILHAPLISISARHRYTDTTNGFRGYSSSLLSDPRLQIFREVFSQYELHYYLAIQAARLGFRITETPVTRTYPKNAKVPTKISPFKGNLLIIKTLLKAAFHQYDPR